MHRDMNPDFIDPALWKLFEEKFKSDTTAASYRSDLGEFCRFCGKNFESVTKDDVERYYKWMKQRIEKGSIRPLTVTKKFRELHSLAQFIAEQKEEREDEGICFSKDYFSLYLKHMEKERELAHSVPIQHMDRLLDAASSNTMQYTILVLLYRAGLTSTEIMRLKKDDLCEYESGGIAIIPDRQEPCYLPADVWNLLLRWMGEREERSALFYNRNGNMLNTMYISRMMKKLCFQAGVPNYSAESVRNCCAFNLFSYGASAEQVAAQMGRTSQQINRYKGKAYKGNLGKQVHSLVNIWIKEP